MRVLDVHLQLPRDLLGALDVPEEQVERRLREMIAIQLFREGRISSGKAAELLGISKLEFVQLLARHGLSYFSETPGELAAEVRTLERLLESQGK
ncbi:MAG: UPF0175 family protein [Thermoflexales bacterium]|nr:UPF0175 family protein [Thermoflexales bacterium]